MESLNKRSDGFYETKSGLFAIVPKSYQEAEDGVRVFKFKPSYFSDTIALEWRGDVAVVDQGAVQVMHAKGYGKHPTQEQADAYNAEYADKPADKPAEKEKGEKGANAPKEPKEVSEGSPEPQKRKTSKPKE